MKYFNLKKKRNISISLNLSCLYSSINLLLTIQLIFDHGFNTSMLYDASLIK